MNHGHCSRVSPPSKPVVRIHTRDLSSVPWRHGTCQTGKTPANTAIRSWAEKGQVCANEQANGNGQALARVYRVAKSKRANDGGPDNSRSGEMIWGRRGERGEGRGERGKETRSQQATFGVEGGSGGGMDTMECPVAACHPQSGEPRAAAGQWDERKQQHGRARRPGRERTGCSALSMSPSMSMSTPGIF